MRLLFSIGLAALLSFGYSAIEAQEVNTVSKTKEAAQDPEKTQVEVIAVDNRIKVTNAPVGSKLEIYSVVGIKVVEIEIKESTAEYPVNIAKGYYIVRIGETVRKVAIR